MKTEIKLGKPPESKVIYFNDTVVLDVFKYYGIESLNTNRAFVTRTKYEEGEYIALCIDEITDGNGFGSLREGSLSNIVECAMRSGYKVYMFDSWGELNNWLINGK